jgi:hypothetical protein
MARLTLVQVVARDGGRGARRRWLAVARGGGGWPWHKVAMAGRGARRRASSEGDGGAREPAWVFRRET